MEGFVSIVNLPAANAGESQEFAHVDSWDDCYDCDYNCEECDSS